MLTRRPLAPRPGPLWAAVLNLSTRVHPSLAQWMYPLTVVAAGILLVGLAFLFV